MKNDAIGIYFLEVIFMESKIAKIKELATAGYVRGMGVVDTHARTLMFVMGVGLLTGGMSELSHAQAFDDSFIRFAVGNLFGLIEGAFGALIMVVAGIAAIVAAAMGAYKAAMGMLVVAVGAFILRSLVSLFFGDGFVAGRNKQELGGPGGRSGIV